MAKASCKMAINGHYRVGGHSLEELDKAPAGAWLICPEEDCCPECGEEIPRTVDLLSSLNLGEREETTEEMLEGFRADIRSRCPRCGLPIHPEREAEAGLCPGCGARHE